MSSGTKCLLVAVLVLVVTVYSVSSAAVIRDTEYELTERESSIDSLKEVVMAAEEEEARAYKGYNGGNRVWYG